MTTATTESFEVNLRVAQACGLSVVTQYGEVRYDEADRKRLDNPGVDCESKSVPPVAKFDPYHDANDALWAAERVGLFDGHRFLTKQDGKWQLIELGDYYQPQGQLAFDQPTVSSAICAAILALKESA